ncbi:NAD(P)-binding domain-containing protein [Streptomyces apocyni]|uniref:NAD(P)-binding domain-containing protein n=1 Tax=Streptomyces apocyni TaxID=2654677 RepID=UPI0012EA49CF|nr:NAD(P)-binding domain-containing protein [Streptomyces apocyni]
MTPRIAVIGAGPIGLDAALACTDAGWPVTVYEAGPSAATHVRAWGHVRLFTPWELNVSPRMRAHLPTAPTGNACPTGTELADRLLHPLTELPALQGRIRYATRVAAISRTGLLKHEHIADITRAETPFTLLLDTPDGEDTAQADIVLDCTGTYANPNTLGDGGIPAPGERALAHRITRTLPNTTTDRASDRWAGTVLLVGAGKSAQTAARDLATLPDTHLIWVVRDAHPNWGAIQDDPLPGRQELVDISQKLADSAHARATVHTGTHIQSLTPSPAPTPTPTPTPTPGNAPILVRLATPQGPQEVRVDHIVSLTGYTGDPTLHRQLQVHECYATGAPMNLSAALLGSSGADCLAQPAVGVDVLRNPEPHFYILGAKSYGRLNTFLLRSGYEQVNEVTSPYAHTRSGHTPLSR